MAGLRWSRRAVDNLEAVLEFIEQDSPAAATKFAQGVMELVEKSGAGADGRADGSGIANARNP